VKKTLLMLLLWVPAAAEPARWDTLTVEQALARAEEHNPELAASTAQARKAYFAWQQIGSFPTTRLGFGLSRGQGPAALNSVSGRARDEFVIAEQELPAFGVQSALKEAAEHELRAAEARLAQQRAQVRKDVKDAFYTLLASQESVVVEEANVVLAQQVLQTNEKFVAEKKGSRLDLLAAQVQRNRAVKDVQIALGEQGDARADLARVLGLMDGRTLRALGELKMAPLEFNLASLLDRAAAAPLTLASQETLARFREEWTAARRQSLPAPSFFALYDFRVPSYQLGAQLSIPLDWGQIRNEARQREEDAREQEARVRATELQVASDIQSSYSTYETALRNASVYLQTIVAPQEEAVTLSRAEYAARTIDYDQMILAEQQLEEVRLEYIDILLAVRLATHRLELAIGAPLQ
jgi:outer membrane protein, heavy metal efflux system